MSTEAEWDDDVPIDVEGTPLLLTNSLYKDGEEVCYDIILRTSELDKVGLYCLMPITLKSYWKILRGAYDFSLRDLRDFFPENPSIGLPLTKRKLKNRLRDRGIDIYTLDEIVHHLTIPPTDREDQERLQEIYSYLGRVSLEEHFFSKQSPRGRRTR